MVRTHFDARSSTDNSCSECSPSDVTGESSCSSSQASLYVSKSRYKSSERCTNSMEFSPPSCPWSISTASNDDRAARSSSQIHAPHPSPIVDYKIKLIREIRALRHEIATLRGPSSTKHAPRNRHRQPSGKHVDTAYYSTPCPWDDVPGRTRSHRRSALTRCRERGHGDGMEEVEEDHHPQPQPHQRQQHLRHYLSSHQKRSSSYGLRSRKLFKAPVRHEKGTLLLEWPHHPPNRRHKGDGDPLNPRLDRRHRSNRRSLLSKTQSSPSTSLPARVPPDTRTPSTLSTSSDSCVLRSVVCAPSRPAVLAGRDLVVPSAACGMVALNVGGQCCTTTVETLQQASPDGMLGRIVKEIQAAQNPNPSNALHLNDTENRKCYPPPRDATGAFFLDVNPVMFQTLLDYLRARLQLGEKAPAPCVSEEHVSLYESLVQLLGMSHLLEVPSLNRTFEARAEDTHPAASRFSQRLTSSNMMLNQRCTMARMAEDGYVLGVACSATTCALYSPTTWYVLIEHWKISSIPFSIGLTTIGDSEHLSHTIASLPRSYDQLLRVSWNCVSPSFEHRESAGEPFFPVRPGQILALTFDPFRMDATLRVCVPDTSGQMEQFHNRMEFRSAVPPICDVEALRLCICLRNCGDTFKLLTAVEAGETKQSRRRSSEERAVNEHAGLSPQQQQQYSLPYAPIPNSPTQDYGHTNPTPIALSSRDNGNGHRQQVLRGLDQYHNETAHSPTLGSYHTTNQNEVHANHSQPFPPSHQHTLNRDVNPLPQQKEYSNYPHNTPNTTSTYTSQHGKNFSAQKHSNQWSGRTGTVAPSHGVTSSTQPLRVQPSRNTLSSPIDAMHLL